MQRFYFYTENVQFNSRMPMDTGIYHVTYTTDGRTMHCEGDPSSIMTVNRDNILINACQNTNTYRK